MNINYITTTTSSRAHISQCKEGRTQSLVMIWLVIENGESAIQLLGEYQPHHLVRERHLAQRHFVVGTSVDFLRETVRPSHNKHQPTHAARHAPLHILSPLQRGVLTAMLIEQCHIVRWSEGRQDAFAFGDTLLVLTQVAHILDVTDVLYLERYIVRQPADILVNPGL